MFRLARVFATDERGAATIDMVALTAAVLLVGMAVVFAIFSLGVVDVVGDMNGLMDSFEF